MARRPLIAGNWKMHGGRADLDKLRMIREAARRQICETTDVVVCPPATLLAHAFEALEPTVAVGGQDCHFAASGPYTGSISAPMLADSGARYVILGHSERRSGCGEDDALVARKVAAAWSAGLVAIVCVGETEAEHAAGRTLAVLREELTGSLPSGATGDNTVIAYEPIWAIGAGRTPTPDEIEKIHHAMREHLSHRIGEPAARAVRLLYGGSVKPENAGEILAIRNVDGALVGGASLNAEDFIAICRSVPEPAAAPPRGGLE
ncbi:triose-phosphate isomerase [Mangrovibrevibacter kandeliae]|uniref:triose-phosphate isomerase n=1 Tax=Mangrovibrevibacter kandeliae TaxID=2968473 RepID=UPI00211975E8|nr:triose-phosphate isomerase [Aurantimonas sp. CSK15Z-1]MCQ8782588.1 triose-phosphate isomerase [Aurantimonas sp. CSK15Z-1]